MANRESALKSALFAKLREVEPNFIVLLLASAGAADRAVVGNQITSYWECKHGTPSFTSKGNQELFCQRLARESFCRYIIWCEDRRGGAKVTMIVHPLRLHPIRPEVSILGHDHVWVSDYIRKVHREYYRKHASTGV